MKQLLLIITFCLTLFSQAQDHKQPKIGLVLSGGGAKGLAHIGALKVIDSLGVKIDYVAGTSMGAIIGSLYASGYSGNQLETIFKDVDFDKIINDDMPRAAKSFYQREDDEKYAISLPFKNFKLKLPSALSRGQNTYNLLSKLLLHVNHIEDFNKLPIPFFCIATNVETGEAVQLEHGNLAQAVMASGAFPSLFQPVVINTQILIDGGVVNNYPIEELKKKGVDIIIGVDVQDELATRKDLTSALDILLQTNNYRTINSMKEKVKLTDIYIKPDISDYTVVSFNDGEQIITNGKKAALFKAEDLNPLINLANKKPKTHISKIDSIYINQIHIKGNTKYTRAYILGKLKHRNQQKTTYSKLSEGANNVIASNNFKSFFYKLNPVANKRNTYNLTTQVVENNQKSYVKFGIHYDDLYKSAILANFTTKRLFTKNDELSFDLILGDNTRYNFDYYIDNGFYWSIGFKSRYNQFNKNVPASFVLTPAQQTQFGVNKLNIELDDFTSQFYLQTKLKTDASLTLGLEHKLLTLKTETIALTQGNNETEFENSDYISLFGSLKLDSLDDNYFPKSGAYFNGQFNWYIYNQETANVPFSQFSIAKANLGYVFNIKNKLSFKTGVAGGLTIGHNSKPYLNFMLGGYGYNFINNISGFHGYDYLELNGDSFVKALFEADYEILKKHHLNLAANYANVGDNIFSSSAWLPAPDFTGYAIGYSYQTFLGPIEAKCSWSPERKKAIWFINLGFWF